MSALVSVHTAVRHILSQTAVVLVGGGVGGRQSLGQDQHLSCEAKGGGEAGG